jgi:hypothetical protein
MADYKTDRDRFDEILRDHEQRAEAAERDQLDALRAKVDVVVKGLLANREFRSKHPTESQARQIAIELLKESRALPPNYVYPPRGST